jgi:phosphate starvation-inducible PhoH-like protein
MPRKIKPVARQTRRDERSRMRNDTRLHALTDFSQPIVVKPNTKLVRPMNDAQHDYYDAILNSEITFGVGPAGTGKTWLAAMMAAEALAAGEIERIVITRPAVEAGESLGFLPGELEEKYEPYIRPVRDALEEKFGAGKLDYMIQNGRIEARPLGLIRGATIKNAWLIADEMQNASANQFKMLLSRIGTNSKFVINGDPRQTDLPSGQSGLMDAVERLASVPGIAMVKFTTADIVRSGMCQRIVEAYER